MPEVSIIISAYNGYDYLPRCIDSILRQTYTNWECLLIDDGSPDGKTPALCDEIALSDTRIHTWHKENGGADSGWRYGLERAQGRWVIFVDQDDQLSPVAIETALRAHSENPQCMVIWNWCNNATELCNTSPAKIPFEIRELNVIGKMYMESNLYFTWNRIFSLPVLQKYKVLPPEGITYGGDMIFCIEYIRACIREGYTAFCHIHLPLYHYETNNTESVNNHFRPTYCDDELKTTSYILNTFLPLFQISDTDYDQILRHRIRTLAEGFGYVLETEKFLTRSERKHKVFAYLQNPALHKLLNDFIKRQLYSPYAKLLKKKRLLSIQYLYRLRQERSPWFNRFYWMGYWLHTLCTGKKDVPFI